MTRNATSCASAFELGAAYYVSTVLRAAGVSIHAARVSYASIPTGGVYRLEHFERAETLLWGCRLIEVSSDNVIMPSHELLEIAKLPYDDALELLLVATVERRPPVWVYAACEGPELAIEAIPDDDWSVITTVIGDPVRREAFLLALGRKFDAEDAASMGSDGEVFVVAQCRTALIELGRLDLADGVRRVSAVSRQLGYKVVAPTLDGEPWRIEVKTTRSRAPVLRVIVSRNEARVGISDRRWILLVCYKSSTGEYEIVGWCHASVFQADLPSDGAKYAQWLTARVTLERASLNDGLPCFAKGGAA